MTIVVGVAVGGLVRKEERNKRGRKKSVTVTQLLNHISRKMVVSKKICYIRLFFEVKFLKR